MLYNLALMKKKTYKIATLGCRTNQYESQAYRDGLKELGYLEVGEKEIADISIINTCTVTQSADQRSRTQIRQFAKQNSDGKLFVTGCFAESGKKEIEAIEGVTKVVPNQEKDNLLAYAFPGIENLPEFSIERFSAHTRAFVKIQDGCNSYCSYCIIPFVRGRSRSKSVPAIVKEIRALIANGYKEIVLTGINIGDFDGGDGNTRLSDLVKIVDNIEGLKRLRISSIDPDEVDDDLLDAVVNGKTTSPSMHIVLQAGSNAILKRMNRKYTKQEFFKAVDRLKRASSDFTFTTDVIVGFPGETDRDFQDTLDVIEEVKFAKVHMFPYSVRPKTRASRFTDPVPKNVINLRREKVLRLSEQVAFELRDEYIGRKMQVLLESPQGNAFSGHTDNFLEVIVKGEKLRSNTLVDVDLIENSPEGLLGELV